MTHVRRRRRRKGVPLWLMPMNAVFNTIVFPLKWLFMRYAPPPLPSPPHLHIHHGRSSLVVSLLPPPTLYEWAIVPEDRIPHTIWRLSQQKQGLTDNASLHLLQHCASQLCQGHVQLGFIHPSATKKTTTTTTTASELNRGARKSHR